MANIKRTPRIINHATKSFLTASLAISAVQQFNALIDGVLVGNLIGPDAVSAVNIAIPISNLIYVLPEALMAGAAMLASRAVGAQDYRQSRRLFSTGITAAIFCVSVLSMLALFNMDALINFSCPDPSYHTMVRDYLYINLLYIPIAALCSGICRFMTVDGQTHLVSTYFSLVFVFNSALDIIFISVLGWGMSGCALATAFSTMMGMVVYIPYLRKSHNSIAFTRCYRGFFSRLKEMAGLGTPTAISTAFVPFFFYCTIIMIQSLNDPTEMFMLSICMQLLSFSSLWLNSASQLNVNVGGMLIGEGDYHGMRLLFRRSWVLLLSVNIVIIAVSWTWPTAFIKLYGGEQLADFSTASMWPIKSFAITCLTFNLCLLFDRLILQFGHKRYYLISSLQLMLLILFSVWGSFLMTKNIWNGFMISNFIVIPTQFILFAIWHRKVPNSSLFTLIPKRYDYPSAYYTLRYLVPDAEACLKNIKTMVLKWDIPEKKKKEIVLGCQSFLSRLLSNHDKLLVHGMPQSFFHDTFDFRIIYEYNKIRIIVKDNSRRTNFLSRSFPIKSARFSHRRMFGLNILNIQIPVEQSN